MVNLRKLLLAVVVILVVLIFVNNIRQMRKSAELQRQAAAKAALMSKDEPHRERVPFTPSHHMPIYDMNGRLGLTADYTSVPYVLGKTLKPLENPDMIIVDRKVEKPLIRTPPEIAQLQTRSDAGSDGELKEREKKLLDEASVATGTVLASPAEIEEQEAIKEAARISRMATSDPAVAQYEEKLEREHNFIKKLPVSNKCKDFEPELCRRWALNNECSINPEFMLMNCPSSCFTCDMTDGEKNMLVTMYNERPPVNCVSHGGYSVAGVDDVFV